ncbi:MAG: shikimate dehydrogenase [Trueperaceae bacterium]
MKRAYLLAHPAGHSLSPAMHNAAFTFLNIEGHYEAVDVAPEQLADLVQSLREPNVYGANVTIPHKVAVMPLMDKLSKAAKTIGAVNTIVNQSGELIGHNTDAAGFLQGLEDERVYLRKKVAVMLGAGGAARAIAYGLLNSGVVKLWIYNRTADKAAELVKEFIKIGSVAVLKEDELPFIIRQAEVVVNTTSVGMEHNGIAPNESPLAKELLPKQGFVCDIIYRPTTTKLLRDAKAANLKTQNGLPMLVYQGVEAFRLWTGEDAPAQVMMEAAKSALQKTNAEKENAVVEK